MKEMSMEAGMNCALTMPAWRRPGNGAGICISGDFAGRVSGRGVFLAGRTVWRPVLRFFCLPAGVRFPMTGVSVHAGRPIQNLLLDFVELLLVRKQAEGRGRWAGAVSLGSRFAPVMGRKRPVKVARILRAGSNDGRLAKMPAYHVLHDLHESCRKINKYSWRDFGNYYFMQKVIVQRLCFCFEKPLHIQEIHAGRTCSGRQLYWNKSK